MLVQHFLARDLASGHYDVADDDALAAA